MFWKNWMGMFHSMSSLIIIIAVMISCGGGGKEAPIETKLDSVLVDIDGNMYKVVQIGNQVWMAENLRVKHYKDGSPVAYYDDAYSWISADHGAYCYYENDLKAADSIGALYNWYSISDSRGLAPEGWRVPSDKDWMELEKYLGMDSSSIQYAGYEQRGDNEATMLKTFHGWPNEITAPEYAGTNESGFSALPSGSRSANDGSYGMIESFAYYWTATENGPNNAWSRYLGIYPDISRAYAHKTAGSSVRCIKN